MVETLDDVVVYVEESSRCRVFGLKPYCCVIWGMFSAMKRSLVFSKVLAISGGRGISL